MNLISLGKLNQRLFAFHGLQRYLCLEYWCMIPSGSFAHTMSLLRFIVEQFLHLCTCPVLPDQLLLMLAEGI
jgi:hypothetical protein